MACFRDGTIIDLGNRESLALPDFRGATLRVTRGSVWITQQDDTRDVVLHGGDTWVVERDGLTLVEAQQDATLCVLGRVPATWATSRRPPAATPWRHVRDFAAAFFVAAPRRTVPYV